MMVKESYLYYWSATALVLSFLHKYTWYIIFIVENINVEVLTKMVGLFLKGK